MLSHLLGGVPWLSPALETTHTLGGPTNCWHPKASFPLATPGSNPSFLQPRVAARSPTRRGYLEPAPGPASSSRSRSRAATRAATSAATAAALSATGPGMQTSLPPRGRSSPHPRRWAPLSGPPQVWEAAKAVPTRHSLPGGSQGRRLAPPTGAGRGEASTRPPELGRWSRAAECACSGPAPGTTLGDFQVPLCCVLPRHLG